MGYKPKRSPFTRLSGRNISYKEEDRTITLISLDRETMTLEVTIKEGSTVKTEPKFPFAHLPKKIKQEIHPL
jgi:hypothetical protein